MTLTHEVNESNSPPAGRPAAGPDGPSTEAREAVSRAELDKVIRERQLAKERARQAEAELAALRARLPESEGDAQPHSEDDPAEVAPDGALARTDELSQLSERLRAREIQLAGMLRDQRLHAAAVAAGALNPLQVVSILRHRVEMAESAAGEFTPRILDERGRPLLDDDGPASDVEAFVERFLGEPANANLVRSSSTPGSGARPTGRPAQGEPIPRTLGGFHALPPDRRRAMALKMSKRQRQAMLGIASPEGAGYL